jgi:hypothetical protein
LGFDRGRALSLLHMLCKRCARPPLGLPWLPRASALLMDDGFDRMRFLLLTTTAG